MIVSIFSTAFLSLVIAASPTAVEAGTAGDRPTCEDSVVASADSIASRWDALLATYATTDGGFRYEALRGNAQDVATLDTLVTDIANASTDGMSRLERLSFLINAYNILTVDSVLELWPVQSVLQEDGFFDRRTFNVAGTTMTLNGLENDHIRTMGEPRIHFLVNCASASCPPLATDAITPANFEQLAASMTEAYIRRTSQIDRDGNTVRVSQIFEWFVGDFGDADGVRSFVADRLEADDAAFVRAETTTVGFFPYDWALNGR